MLDDPDVGSKLKRSDRLKIVYQTEASECGLACLVMLANFHRINTDILTLRSIFPISRSGMTLRSIISAGERIGLGSRALRVKVEDLSEVKLPALIHWDLNHFVVLKNIKKTRRGLNFVIFDPARGVRLIGREDFSASFTGIALEVWPDTNLRQSTPRKILRPSHLWSKMDGLWGNLLVILALSIVSQAVSLALPFYLQIGIDNTVPSGDLELLAMLGIGFLGLALISVVASWLRLITTANLNAAFQFQILNNLFRHLLSLPISWFGKRHVGDIVSRFSSTGPVVDYIGSSFSSVVFDAFVTIVTVGLMLLYSPLLCAVAVICWALFVIARFSSIAVVKTANVNLVSTTAKESTAFIENIRGALTIKAFSRENDRRLIWQDVKADALRAQLTLTKISSVFEAITGSILSFEQIIISFMAIWLTVKGDFTLGMVFAFQSYRQQFADSSTRLVDQYYRYRMLNVHLDRIGDIAFSVPERSGDERRETDAIEGKIALRNVSFRYGEFDRPTLLGVSLDIEPGETIALIGPSGGGKTTLIKIMMGLLMPSSGAVFVDGVNIDQMGAARWREKLGSVLQEDSLFAGTLADNISFFDQQPDREKILKACKDAAIHEYIEQTPLGLESTVGDMGSSLSGGQRQRVMLARALYVEPVALFMDEGTANLDSVSEARVLETLKSLPITQILSAHRLAVIDIADRVFYVSDTQVKELDKRELSQNGGGINVPDDELGFVKS